MEKSLVTDLFRELRCCVLVPTYNNQKTLASVLTEILSYTSSVIVVNDGSTDSTSEILNQFQGLTLISYSPNRGKGWALRKGLEKAAAMGFEYCISIDSDGQHMPADFGTFLTSIQANPGSLIVGARNMSQNGIPAKSSFGHKFSNFWFTVETGIQLPDTQSGFRLYPVQRMKSIPFHTVKYEFEIENIVKAAWKGIPVISCPISVYYAPGKERITHFRPFKDFTRISILNTWLVTQALLFYRPLLLLRSLKKKNVREILKAVFSKPGETNWQRALSFGLGIFFGLSPFWGYQMILTAALAVFFKLNKVIALIASNISLPPLIPLIVVTGIEFGEKITGHEVDFKFEDNFSPSDLSDHLLVYGAGSLSLAILASVVSTVIVYLTLSAISIVRPKK